MAFGMKGERDTEKAEETERTLVPAITTETVVGLLVLVALFAVFAFEMGLAFTFKTMMATAHDLILETVLFLMGVMIMAGAFTAFIAEFGIVAIANRALAPLMRPIFGLPGATSVGVVATYLSDNPAIMPLGLDRGFLKYLRRWQVATLVNLGTVFGMGLIVTTFMLAQGVDGRSLGSAVLIGNVGAIVGGIFSVRAMAWFAKRRHGRSAEALPEDHDEGHDPLKVREVRPGNRAQRTLQSMLDGGAHGVQMGLDIMPGVIIICTLVMMFSYGAPEGGYTGAAYEGIAFFPWVGEQLSFIIEPLFGFADPRVIAFPVTSWASVGAALGMIPQFLETGVIGAKGIAVLTAIGICNAGFLSTHVGMMDGLGERDLATVAIGTHFVGGLIAGMVAHGLFLLFG